jgi:hypothetical protein
MPTPGEPSSSGHKPNSHAALLTTLAQSSHAWVQFGTLLLVGLAGLGNWVATWNSSNQNRQEIEVSRRVNWEGQERLKAELIRQVDEIHSWMREATGEFHQGNADSSQNKKILVQFKEDLEGFEARQLAVLNNQNQIMRNQTEMIQEIHAFVQQRKKQLNQ